MVRKIYENAIYLRKKQNTRKVYQRSNNVLPIEVPGAGEEEINIVDEGSEQNDAGQNDAGQTDANQTTGTDE